MRLLPLKVRDSWVVFLSAVMIFACAAVADAQRIRRPPKSPFHAGQKVEVDWMGKTQSGEVVSIEMTGWVKVRFQDNGNERVWPFPPDQVRVPKMAATAKAGQAKPPIRTWTDSTGQFKLDARFVSLQDGKVTLEKADGSTKTLPLEKLSEEDQTAAKKFGEKTPSANPFEGSDDAASPAGGTGGEPAKDEDIVAPAGDWLSVQDIMVNIAAKGQFVPDAAGGEPLQEMRTVMMDLTKGARTGISRGRNRPGCSTFVRGSGCSWRRRTTTSAEEAMAPEWKPAICGAANRWGRSFSKRESCPATFRPTARRSSACRRGWSRRSTSGGASRSGVWNREGSSPSVGTPTTPAARRKCPASITRSSFRATCC